MNSLVSATLVAQDLWTSDHPYMEMIARKSPLFPSIDLNISGLSKDQYYKIVLTIERIDSTRYTFDSKSEQWIESKMRYAKDGYESKKIEHPHNILSGDFWMATPLRFGKVKISCKKEDADLENVFFIPTMYKYAPVVTIINVDTKEETKVVIDAAQFIAVTVYTHPEMGSWKAAHNKYTTLRHGGKGKRKNETSEDKRSAKRRKELKEIENNDTTYHVPTMPASPIDNTPSTSNIPSPVTNDNSPTQRDLIYNYHYEMTYHQVMAQYLNAPFYNPNHSIDSSFNTTHSFDQSFYNLNNAENVPPPYFPPF